ncbi:hypothetical protein ACFVRD_36905 [Streptomyces sp. NPDC057908]|uniref:hypothetical protein n=1 Tax=Streptomyces sp. NPDC057908 TaxID=3346276 RepID=UPI0036E0069A
MRRRLVALLLALVAVFGVSVSAPSPAAADGPISNTIEGICRVGTGPVLGTILGIKGKVTGVGGLTGAGMCDAIGEVGEKAIKDAWKNVWDSVLGDIVRSGQDVGKWVIKKVLTFSLLGPSVDLEGTGLWGGKATLAGMLTWLGLVIAVAGIMWQLGKMALTGQTKHAGRAMTGWIENLFLSTLGVSLFALLLVLGDAMSAGLVNETFADDGQAYERIVAVLLPTIGNPITMLCVVAVLLLIGFIQLIMIFLRQSAIPIICLLLPVAGGGRTGGDATRKWAPTLITSGMVIVAYKPTVAIIICTGFAEFGHSKTLAEWLRGAATLVLAVIAPGPLTKIFAPFGAAVGAGMSAGGASGALGAAAGYFAGKAGGGDGDGGGGGGGGGGGDDGPDDAVKHAQRVAQSMGEQGSGDPGEDGTGSDAQAQAARNEAGARVPGQGGPEGVEGVDAGTVGEGLTEGTAGTAGTTGTAAAGAGVSSVALPVAATIQVLDGVNDAVQGASGAVGGGDQQ